MKEDINGQLVAVLLLLSGCGQRVNGTADGADTGAEAALHDVHSTQDLVPERDVVAPHDASTDVASDTSPTAPILLSLFRAIQGTSDAAGTIQFRTGIALFAESGARDPRTRRFERDGCEWYESPEIPRSAQVGEVSLRDSTRTMTLPYLERPMGGVYFATQNDPPHWNTGEGVEFRVPSLGLRESLPLGPRIMATIPDRRVMLTSNEFVIMITDVSTADTVQIVISGFTDRTFAVGRRAFCTFPARVGPLVVPPAVIAAFRDGGELPILVSSGTHRFVSLPGHTVSLRIDRIAAQNTYQFAP
ncbi:MAG: hypothetical protein Q8Q09_20420 [Deltaproteobacteria bacterium]|nr:hypothetical protein [Deltaproteobacteria bacterium]